MKKWAYIFLSFLSILSLTSCNNKSVVNDGSKKNTFKVGLVSDTAGINDEAFNSSAWDGMVKVEKYMSFNIKYLESKQESDYGSNLDKLTDDKLDAIFAVGYRMASAVENIASQNPDQFYVLLDYKFTNPLPNVLSIEFKDQESSFLAGYVAAYMTQTNKVAMITGGEGEVIDRFRYGFESGVNYGAREIEKNITVDVQCINSFQDDAKGKAMANSMYSNGNDIIFTVAGNVGKGVIESAKENNKYAIGVDQDQNYLAPDNVLTSAMKLVGGAVYDVCDDIRNGVVSGGNSKSVGLKEGGVDLASTTNRLVPKDVMAKVETVKNKIIDQEIIPPFDQETFSKFNQK